MTKEFKIEGMSCGHCVMAVKKAISKLDVKNSDVQVGKVVVEFDETKLNQNEIAAAISDSGYEVIEIK